MREEVNCVWMATRPDPVRCAPPSEPGLQRMLTREVIATPVDADGTPRRGRSVDRRQKNREQRAREDSDKGDPHRLILFVST